MIDGRVLKHIVTEVEEAESSKAEWAEHIKEIYATGKAKGLDPKFIKKLIKARAADREKLVEDKELLLQYAFALDPELAEVLS